MCADKGAMAAVLGFDVSNLGVGKKLLPRFRQNAHERIIGGMDNQLGPREVTDQVGSGSSGVIVIRAGEAAVVSGHSIIKLSQRFYSAQTRSIEVSGEQTHLAAKSPKQLQQEIVFVNPVGRFMQRIRAGRQVHRRTNRRYRAKLRWTVASPLSRQLQHKIATHRKPNQHEARNSVALN